MLVPSTTWPCLQGNNTQAAMQGALGVQSAAVPRSKHRGLALLAAVVCCSSLIGSAYAQQPPPPAPAGDSRTVRVPQELQQAIQRRRRAHRHCGASRPDAAAQALPGQHWHCGGGVCGLRHPHDPGAPLASCSLTQLPAYPGCDVACLTCWKRV